MPLFTADELIATAPLPQPSIVGRGLFTEHGTWLITGKTESGKSVLAFDIAISLVLEQPLFRAHRKKHGQEGKPYFPVNHSSRVLYLDNELGPQGCHDRLMLFKESRKIGVPLGDSLKFISGDYEPILLHETTTDKKPYQNLRKLIEKERPTVLIVDPLGDFHLEDEDSNRMRVVFRYIRALQNEFKFASILIHHETDKQLFDSRGMPIQREGTGRSRGHSSIAQSVDSMLAIRRIGKTAQTFWELSWEKVRHQSHPPAGTVFGDLGRMHIEWVCSNREQGLPAKQQAFLDTYKSRFGDAQSDDE